MPRTERFGWAAATAGAGFDYLFMADSWQTYGEESGRTPESCPIYLFSAPTDIDTLKRYRGLGFVHVSVSVPSAKDREVLPILDRWAALLRQL